MKKKILYALIPFSCGVYLSILCLMHRFEGSVLAALFLVLPILYLIIEFWALRKNASFNETNNPIVYDVGSIPSTPPIDSLITLEKKNDGTTALHFPKKGFSMADIPHLCMCIALMPFVFFATLAAIQADKFIAFIAIPLWLVDIGLWKGFLNSISETQIIYLIKDQVYLEKSSILGLKRLKYLLDGTVSVRTKHLKTLPFGFSHPYGMFSEMTTMWKTPLRSGEGIDILAFVSDEKIDFFFERANDAEKKWVVRYVGGHIEKLRKTPQ
jgi:hypothetical protein